jgi:hypothetical protein
MLGRTTALDARNYFDAAPLPKGSIDLKQFGASLGGAIKKDHLFYFADYEGQRYSVEDTLFATAPTTITFPGGPDKSRSPVDACKAGFLEVVGA